MSLNIEDIKDKIALRYPYLLVDRVVELNGEKVTALKNVTINEPFFQGHFPEPYPSVMPGTMIVECMAQVSGIIAYQQTDQEGIGLLVGVDEARFRKQVTPGDQLVVEASMARVRRNIAKVGAEAFVEDDLVADAKITLAFPKNTQSWSS